MHSHLYLDAYVLVPEVVHKQEAHRNQEHWIHNEVIVDREILEGEVCYEDPTEALAVQEYKLVKQQQVGQCNISFGATSCFVFQSCVLSTSASPSWLAPAKT